MELKKAGEFTSKRIEEQVVGTRPKRLNRFEFEGLVAGTEVKSQRVHFATKTAHLATGSSRKG